MDILSLSHWLGVIDGRVQPKAGDEVYELGKNFKNTTSRAILVDVLIKTVA